MKSKNISLVYADNVTPWRSVLIGAVAAFLFFDAFEALAVPILSGDVDQIVTVDPSADCVGCTAHQLDVLERGVGMMLIEMRNTAVDSQVCVSEASLAKDMAVLAFEAYKSGAVAESRWRDSLRYKGRFSGRLTDAAIDSMLLAYREALEERLGIEIRPGSFEALQTDIYASAQLSRLFFRMAGGEWQNLWLPALDDSSGGFNPVVDAVVGLRWSGRGIYNEILIYSRVDVHWREAELARMTHLQDDFLAGTVGADRDQLAADYRGAMAADPWTVMGAGCAVQAAVGFRKHALELSQGITYIAQPEKGEPFSEVITVTGEMPGILDGTVGSVPPPFGPQPGRNNRGHDGSSGRTGGGSSGTNDNKPSDRACTTREENEWTVIVSTWPSGRSCPRRTRPGETCRASNSYIALWESRCNRDDTSSTPAPTPPETQGPLQDAGDIFRDSLSFFCEVVICNDSEGGWSTGISPTGPAITCNCP